MLLVLMRCFFLLFFMILLRLFCCLVLQMGTVVGVMAVMVSMLLTETHFNNITIFVLFIFFAKVISNLIG